MSFYFIGGEDVDFRMLGNSTITTSGGYFRAGYARCALAAERAADGAYGMEADFSQSISTFWMTGQLRCDGDPTTGRAFLLFYDGSTKRIAISANAGSKYIEITTFDDGGVGTALTLTNNTYQIGIATIQKYDVYVNLATGIRVFQGGVEIATYSGAIPVGTSTTLNRFRLGSFSTNGLGNWSEIIVSDLDTRSMTLKTHTPVANGTYAQWTGSYTDIDEATIMQEDAINTDTAENTASFAMDDSPAGTFVVRAVKVSSLATKGSAGPQNLQLGVRVGTTDSFSPTLAVDTGWSRMNYTWETNPVSGTAWTTADVDGIEIIVKAKA